jgi:hypothetical protein
VGAQHLRLNFGLATPYGLPAGEESTTSGDWNTGRPGPSARLNHAPSLVLPDSCGCPQRADGRKVVQVQGHQERETSIDCLPEHLIFSFRTCVRGMSCVMPYQFAEPPQAQV